MARARCRALAAARHPTSSRPPSCRQQARQHYSRLQRLLGNVPHRSMRERANWRPMHLPAAIGAQVAAAVRLQKIAAFAPAMRRARPLHRRGLSALSTFDDSPPLPPMHYRVIQSACEIEYRAYVILAEPQCVLKRTNRLRRFAVFQATPCRDRCARRQSSGAIRRWSETP